MTGERLDSLGLWDALAATAPERLTEQFGREGAGDVVPPAIEHLRSRSVELIADDSPARRLARRIGRTMPIIYGGGVPGLDAATCWKSACNLHAKLPAFANEIVAVTHEEICGWGQNGDVTRQVFSLILLRHSGESPDEAAAFDVVADICDEIVADVHTVVAQGPNRLAELCDLVLFGDVVSLELAAVAGVDPGPTPILERFT